MQFNNNDTKTLYRRLLTTITSVLAIFSIGADANDNNDRELELWLKEIKPINTSDKDTEHFAETANVSEYFYFKDDAAQEPTEAILLLGSEKAKSKRFNTKKEKLLRGLKDKFKWTLYKNNNRYSKHRFYVNTLKQELVAKSQFRKFKFDLRLSEDQAKAKVRYALN
ncbi:MAG: hypothetical protein AAFZ92_10910 [Pseudomonadota bacterium]